MYKPEDHGFPVMYDIIVNGKIVACVPGDKVALQKEAKRLNPDLSVVVVEHYIGQDRYL